MKIKYLTCLIPFSFFLACLDSDYTVEVEESSNISFDDCPFYGFWADTLWCADTLILYSPYTQSLLDTQLVIRGTQYMDVHDWPDYRRFSFTFIIHDFQGVGKYSYPNAYSAEYYGDDFEFTIVDWDILTTRFNVENEAEGAYGEVWITQFDPNTRFIKGEARGLLTDARGDAANPQQRLRGGNFQGFIK